MRSSVSMMLVQRSFNQLKISVDNKCDPKIEENVRFLRKITATIFFHVIKGVQRGKQLLIAACLKRRIKLIPCVVLTVFFCKFNAILCFTFSYFQVFCDQIVRAFSLKADIVGSYPEMELFQIPDFNI